MKLTSVVVCEDNVPTDVVVFGNEPQVHEFLLKHYQSVWQSAEAQGDRPDTWQEIVKELDAQGCLADRDIAHIQQHEFDAFA